MLPTEFVNLTLLMEVTPETWKGVLAAAGESERLNGTPFSHEWLLQSLTSQDPAAKLLDALEVIVELGTDEGHELLLRVAADAQVPLEGVEDIPVRELAAREWIRSQSNPALGVVLVRARVNSHQIAHVRASREFVGKSANPALPLTQPRLDAALREHLEPRHREALEVFAYERDGDWHCEVLRGDAAKRVVEVRAGRAGILNYQSAASDHLRYEPETGRLAISTRSSQLLQTYRRVMGTVLAKDAEFFADENICSLKPLQQHGRALFKQHSMHQIAGVDVVELRWRKGDRDQLIVRGRDCFQILEDVHARLNEGELIEAKLSIAIAGQTRRSHASIKVPNRIEIKAGAKKPVVEQLLDQVGIRGVFGEGDERQDFWSLYPWRLSAEEWRRQVGRDFDSLVHRRALRTTKLDVVTHPNHPAAAGALRVEHVDGAHLGISDDSAIGARTLSETDIDGYELHLPAIVKEIAKALGLDGAISEVTSGLWSLGRRALSTSTTITVFLATRLPSQAATLITREANRKERAVLLVPYNCQCNLGVTQLDCRLPAGPHDDLLSRVVKELDVQDEVCPTLCYSDDLILDEKNNRAWYQQIELTLTPQPFKFAVTVARAKGDTVPKEVLNRALSPAREDDDTAKQAKADFMTALKTALRATGRACPPTATKLFTAVSGVGYKLVGTARII